MSKTEIKQKNTDVNYISKKRVSKFLNKFPIGSHRLAGHDYGSNGAYFITIKTHKMKCYFGEIVQTSQGTSTLEPVRNIEMLEKTPLKLATHNDDETCISTSRRLTEIGEKAIENWLSIPSHFHFVELDAFQIMPNHLHGILWIKNELKKDIRCNQFKSLPGTIGTIINQYKGSITRYANLHKIDFQWHPRYHDKIIRHEKALINFRNYINDNPKRWTQQTGRFQK